MKGTARKTSKREPKMMPTKKVKVISENVSSPAIKELNAVPGNDFTVARQSTERSSMRTPKKGRQRIGWTQEACLTSTPIHSSSVDVLSNISPGVRQVDLKSHGLISELETSEVNSPSSEAKSQSRRRRGNAFQPRQVKRKAPQTCSETNSRPVKCWDGRNQGTETRKLKELTTTQSSERTRPRFEPEEHNSAEQDESLTTSDLSIELSLHEEKLPSLSWQEEEESDEEEELPSFSMQMDKKPPSITEGVFVWHKCRNYPFWPALVKSVNHKQKKASIVFIDYSIFEKKKGFGVALKSLKPLDCEEAKELMRKAKEQYDAAVTWSLELIRDYTFRIASGSFSGSFIEYFAHDMSYPVRRKYPQEASERLTITSDTITFEGLCGDLEEDSFNEQQEDVSSSSKRLLPDRTHAAHNRANEKLVYFIVKQRMVEGHLLAVISGQQQSRWLRSFFSANRKRVVNTYLEDDQQLDQVYRYLSELFATAVATASCLAEVKSTERVPFVLEVLLPEAIIYAIAGVDNVPVKNAEEKYLKGRCISNRERQEFDLMIEKQMKKKSQHQNTAIALLSDPST